MIPNTIVEGRVDNFFEGKFRVPGIKIGLMGWFNAPEGSNILSKDLEGQFVNCVLEDVYGDGQRYITGLTTQNGEVRKLSSKSNFSHEGVKAKSNQMISEWLIFYNGLCEKLVPKNVESKDFYLVREYEFLAAKSATELWKQFRKEKVIFLECVKEK